MCCEGYAGIDALCFIVAALEDHRSVGQVPRIEIRGWRNEVGLRRLSRCGQRTGCWATRQQFGKAHKYPWMALRPGVHLRGRDGSIDCVE